MNNLPPLLWKVVGIKSKVAPELQLQPNPFGVVCLPI